MVEQISFRLNWNYCILSLSFSFRAVWSRRFWLGFDGAASTPLEMRCIRAGWSRDESLAHRGVPGHQSQSHQASSMPRHPSHRAIDSVGGFFFLVNLPFCFPFFGSDFDCGLFCFCYCFCCCCFGWVLPTRCEIIGFVELSTLIC